ncbi:MAG: DUF6502 family protein [Pseudomonadales bacterium]|nr:DUF6502 family protein [Pseudomonadales bacterium]
MQQLPNQPPAVLLRAIRKLLRPLVKLLLSYQITYPALIGMLKSVYIEVAEEDFQMHGKRSSDSRINLLTGVHRKDVKRLRQQSSEQAEIPQNISIGSQLIGYWLGSKEFLDDHGRPRALAVSSSDQELPGFDELVKQVCRQDIRPRVILDEWLHLGIAKLDQSGKVILNKEGFIPEQGFDEKVFFFGKNLHDHLATGTDNLLGKKPPRFDRSVYYDRLSQDSVLVLASLAEETGMQALRKMNEAALHLQKDDETSGLQEAYYRMNFGIFNYNTAYIPDEKSSEPGIQDENRSKGDQHA